MILGVGTPAGTGFTVSPFITDLELTDPISRSHGELGVLTASIAAAASSILLLRRRPANDQTTSRTTDDTEA